MRFAPWLGRLFGGGGSGVSRDDARLVPRDDPQDIDCSGGDPIKRDCWDAESEALARESEAELDALEEELARWSGLARGGPVRDRAQVDILLCPACGVYGEHLLDPDGFPAECRTCGWEGAAV